jgi:hypothetical protein
MKTNFNTSNAEIKLNLDKLKSLGRKALRIFDVICSYSNNCMEVYPARETIAYKAECNISYVDRVIATLVEIGAMIKIKRPYPYTNLYKLNPIFYLPEIREQLRHLISSFAVWGMASIMRAGAAFKQNASLLYMYILNSNGISKKTNEWLSDDDIKMIQKVKDFEKSPNEVLKRINTSIFKRLASITLQKWNEGKQERIAERKYLAAAAASFVRYKPTQEQLNRLLKRVDQTV